LVVSPICFSAERATALTALVHGRRAVDAGAVGLRSRLLLMACATEDLTFCQFSQAAIFPPTPDCVMDFLGRIDMIQFEVLR
jgi:hypothetical protein